MSKNKKAVERGYAYVLDDHRGRHFNRDFYPGRSGHAPGWFVWGYSASGASKVVAWPPTSHRAPHPRSGRKVRTGWSSEAKAQAVADKMMAAFGRTTRTPAPTACFGDEAELESDGWEPEEFEADILGMLDQLPPCLLLFLLARKGIVWYPRP